MMDYIERRSPAFAPPKYGQEFYSLSGHRRPDEHPIGSRYQPPEAKESYALDGRAHPEMTSEDWVLANIDTPIDWADANIHELRKKYRGMYVVVFAETRGTHREFVAKAFRTPEELEEFELQMGYRLDGSYAMYIPEVPLPPFAAYAAQSGERGLTNIRNQQIGSVNI